jgi:undecaprenyl-diphosphatase
MFIYHLLAVIAFCVFVAIWLLLGTDVIKAIDQFGERLFEGNTFLQFFHYLGEVWFVTLVGVAFVIYFYVKKRYSKIFFILFTYVGGTIINQGLKFLIERPRPIIPDQLTSYSFPSGHSMLSMLYMMTTAYLVTSSMSKNKKRIAFIIAGIGTLLVGLSRVAGARHFMSDVFGGWTLGFSFFMLVVYWYTKTKK